MLSTSASLPVGIVRDNPVPYYAQLAAILRGKIENGDWRPHDRLPSEAELEHTYGVSRTVVRQALSLLDTEGFLHRRKGKGTFVAERKLTAALLQTLTSFYDEMAARGHPPVSRILTLEREAATRDIALLLSLAANTWIIKLRRLRFVDGEPLVLSTTYIPYDLCPGLLEEDLTRSSLYGLIERKYGLEIVSGVRHIEAIPAPKDEARMLRIKAGAPLLVVSSTTYLRSGRAIEFSIAKHRADRTRFEAHLLRGRPGAALQLEGRHLERGLVAPGGDL